MDLSESMASFNSSELGSTENITQGADGCLFPQKTAATKIAKVCAYSVIMAVALVGNILVIAVICKNRNMRRTINYFIVNIAISDLIVPIVVIPRILVELNRDSNVWLINRKTGEALCKIVYFLSDVTPMVSILSLIFMTVDRFCAVSFPLKVDLITSRCRYILISVTWFVSVGFAIPLLYAMQLLPGPTGEVYCILSWSPADADHTAIQRAYSTATSLLFLVFPFIILTVLYSIILMKTKSSTKLARHRTAAGQRKEQKTSRRLTLMALTIVLAFGFSWGPINVFFFLLTFIWEWKLPTFCGWQSVMLTVQFVSYSNAAINPCIYFLFIKNFREGLKNIFNQNRMHHRVFKNYNSRQRTI